jgi:hypothetical protein
MDDDILKSLHKQFTINDATLFKITTTFLNEISEGLSSYGRPMAMMHVFSAFLSYYSISNCHIVLHLSRAFQTAQRQGTCNTRISLTAPS